MEVFGLQTLFEYKLFDRSERLLIHDKVSGHFEGLCFHDVLHDTQSPEPFAEAQTTHDFSDLLIVHGVVDKIKFLKNFGNYLSQRP